MKTIYKYNIEPDFSKQAIAMPADARIMSAGLDGMGRISIWAEVDTNKPNQFRYFWCVGTGWNLDKMYEPSQQSLKFIGTVLIPNFNEVYHIYETKEY